MQIQDNFVPPILFTTAPNCFGAIAAPSSVSHLTMWRFVACQVLSDSPTPLRQDSAVLRQPNPLALLPIARSPSR
jgi:hypothetical protein